MSPLFTFYLNTGRVFCDAAAQGVNTPISLKYCNIAPSVARASVSTTAPPDGLVMMGPLRSKLTK
jgi:hypothetical protein